MINELFSRDETINAWIFVLQKKRKIGNSISGWKYRSTAAVAWVPGFVHQFLQHYRIGENVFRYIQIEKGSLRKIFAAILDQFEIRAFDETGRME